MSRKIKIVGIVILLMSIFALRNIYASTNTFERTEDNLQIDADIYVTESVKRAALKTPKVDETEKIYDFAYLLSETEEMQLYSKISEFIQEYNMDMVVVTINDNNKSSAMEYADDFYDYNYFGKGSTHDGILLLIDMETRNYWISTTGEAQRIYSDSRINTMKNHIQKKLSSALYKNAVDEFITRASEYASLGVPSSNENTYIDENGDYVSNSGSPSLLENLGSAFIFGSIITVIFIIVGVSGHRNVKKANNAKYYLVDGSLDLREKNDVFINSNTTSVRIESSSSSGGSSTHIGSSGRSHGGGGGRF